jgi:hypothetical protein
MENHILILVPNDSKSKVYLGWMHCPMSWVGDGVGEGTRGPQRVPKKKDRDVGAQCSEFF